MQIQKMVSSELLAPIIGEWQSGPTPLFLHQCHLAVLLDKLGCRADGIRIEDSRL
jgi:hypothetical protein